MSRGAHEHEWIVPEDESAYCYEDGAMHINRECNWVEVTGSAHSEKHDETFYSYGAECDAHEVYRFDLTKIEHQYCETYDADDIDGRITLADGREEVLSFYDRHPALLEEIERAAAETLCGGEDGPEALAWHSFDHVDTSDHTITVEVDDEQFRLTYEFSDRRLL